MKNYLLLLVLSFFVSASAFTQRKWKGGQGTAWDNPLNWEPAGVPAISDDIVLDNSYDQTNYTVLLPVTAITVSSLVLSPDGDKTIKLVISASNLSSPALTVTAADDALVIGKGAVFQNASGLSSGQSLRIAGKIRINNGGTYIHNTRSAHANDVVAKLSVADGTEEGLFEFDIPAASSTISLSNRVFGKLRLSSSTYNGNVAYSGGGSNPVTIRSDLEITDRVSFSVGFSNTVSIKRNLLQSGGVFNISNDNNATTVAIAGDILQTGGVITETGTAKPVLLLNGNSRQELLFAGGLSNEIIVRADNVAGFELQSSLTVPYRLELINGTVKTSSESLLSLSAGCTLKADSLSAGFINGPLKKLGLSGSAHFLFPIGNGSRQRWVALKNATGDFTISYKQENPYNLSAVMSDGLHHVSSIETWRIDAEPETAEAVVELSFDNLYSGGVTDLQTLRAAQLIRDLHWRNRLNTGTTGSAGAAGSVMSEMITAFDDDKNYFTLGSSVSNHNILPQNEVLLKGKREANAIRFDWETLTEFPIVEFVLESAAADLVFHPVEKIIIQPYANRYTLLYQPGAYENYFRMKVIVKDAAPFFSKVIFIGIVENDEMISNGVLVNNEISLKWNARHREQLTIQVHDMNGRMLIKKYQIIAEGNSHLKIPTSGLSKGLYVITIVSKERRQAKKFIKF
jgi:hypothetical protein